MNIPPSILHPSPTTVISVIAAIIAAYSARQTLRSNRIDILPVLTLDISGTHDAAVVKLKNIGKGVAHDIKIPAFYALANKETPSRLAQKITFKSTETNYIPSNGEIQLEHNNHLVAWYLKISKEGVLKLPVFYSDSIGTRYVTIFAIGNKHIDISVSPRKFGIRRRVDYLLSFYVWGPIERYKFRHKPNSPQKISKR